MYKWNQQINNVELYWTHKDTVHCTSEAGEKVSVDSAQSFASQRRELLLYVCQM